MHAFLQSSNLAFPSARFQMEDVDSVELGVLPMRAVDANGPVLYGSARIKATDGMVEVLSTKYTTFRSQARAIMSAAKPFLRE